MCTTDLLNRAVFELSAASAGLNPAKARFWADRVIARCVCSNLTHLADLPDEVCTTDLPNHAVFELSAASAELNPAKARSGQIG